MTETEALKILAVLRSAYPRFYANQAKADIAATASLWAEMFDEPYPVVGAAVKALIASDSKGFPPVIGQVKEKIRLLKHPDEMTGMEAWSYVAAALRNSTYGSKEEFERLPPVVQRLVGSPSQLREWASMDVEVVQSVVASNFQRSYQSRAKAEQEYQALPESVKTVVGQLAEQAKMPELPVPDEAQLLREKNEKIKRLRATFAVQDAIAEVGKELLSTPREEPETVKMTAEEFNARRQKFMEQLKGET